jgi:hypothetical protein
VPGVWRTLFQDPPTARLPSGRIRWPQDHGQADRPESIQEARQAALIARDPTLALHEAAQQERQHTDARLEAELWVRPVVWRADSPVAAICALAAEGFRPALPARGQDDRRGRPRRRIGDQEPRAEDLRCQRLEGGVVDPPRQPVGPGPLSIVRDRSHRREVRPRPQGRYLCAGAGRDARAAVRCGHGLLPRGEGLHPCGHVLVEPPYVAHPPLRADAADHRPLHAPDGAWTARHGERGPRPGAQGGVRRRGKRPEVSVWAGPEGGHIVHGARVDQRLVVRGGVPLVVDQGELLEWADHARPPLADGGARGGKPRGLHRMAFGEVRIPGDRSVPGHQQGQAALAQIAPLLRRVAPLGSRGALMAARQGGENVGSSVDEGLQCELAVLDDGAGACRVDRRQSYPRHGVHLIPARLAGEGFWAEGTEVRPRGPLGPDGPGPRGAGPPGPLDRRQHEGRAHSAGAPGGGEMALDPCHQSQPIRHGLHGGHLPMWVRTERDGGLGVRQQPLQELVGRAKRPDGNRPRLPVDAAGLHDTVVRMSTDLHSLEASHSLWIYCLHRPVKSFLTMISLHVMMMYTFSGTGQYPSPQAGHRLPDVARTSRQ